MKKLLNWLFIKLGGEPKLITMNEQREKRILKKMSEIEKINDFWELQKQIGYQLYGKTDDKRWLGYVSLADTVLKAMDNVNKPLEEAQPSDNGYEAEA